MLKRAAVLVVSCGALLSGCGDDARSENSENQEVISNLVQAGFQANDIHVIKDAVYVGGDAHVTLEASRELLQNGEGSKEHYRTTNLVDTSVVRKICINPTSTFLTYPLLSQGLDMAIANYNALGLCFTMVRGPATGCNANITANTMAGTGGSAGFPSGGRPYSSISIGVGLNSTNVDMVEHVITHELGHTIGLRHSDYYAQTGCGTSEGSAGVGAILIPGTPTTSLPGMSIMNACIPPNPTGEFTSYDITAIRYLYGGC
ncbi:zinc-dependent metalloprotease [Pyxidicoccus parkwayensis]|uniref:Zinc-dependent metalloprotease n=1 Tax=Pyxidicoccus parkwayensis TaxID=2813578 RepID=A0ABX7NNB7_9BACT|nr:zinc-dependent metalloprotease [Pyxidicoccus parkwaysis]QSQ19075.1 zinc-dependent metalloprotease [Pyxidicoccus parkwaysis]